MDKRTTRAHSLLFLHHHVAAPWARAAQRVGLALALFGLASPGRAEPSADPSSTSQPQLPDGSGPDLSGEPGVRIILGQGAPRVDIDGQLYTLENRPLELAFDDLDHITLLFELPTPAQLRVRSAEGEALLSSADGQLDYLLERARAGDKLLFELVGESSSSPPIEIVLRPLPDKPEPD